MVIAGAKFATALGTSSGHSPLFVLPSLRRLQSENHEGPAVLPVHQRYFDQQSSRGGIADSVCTNAAHIYLRQEAIIP